MRLSGACIMRYAVFSFTAWMLLCSAAALSRAAKPPMPPGNPGTKGTHFVWTNEDLEKLRSRGLISIVGPGQEETPKAQSPPAQPYERAKDPDWYAVEAAKLRQEIQASEAQLQSFRNALAAAQDNRIPSGGFKLDQVNAGLTPNDEIAIRGQRNKECGPLPSVTPGATTVTLALPSGPTSKFGKSPACGPSGLFFPCFFASGLKCGPAL